MSQGVDSERELMTPSQGGGFEQSSPQVWKPLLANFSAFAILAPIFIAAFRVLLISQGDPGVMLAIISTLNVKTVVFGSVLPIVPSLGILALASVSIVAHNRVRDAAVAQQTFWRTLQLVAIGVAVILVPVSTIFTLIVGGIGAIVTLVIIWRTRRRVKALRKGSQELESEIKEVGRKIDDAEQAGDLTAEAARVLADRLQQVKAKLQRLTVPVQAAAAEDAETDAGGALASGGVQLQRDEYRSLIVAVPLILLSILIQMIGSGFWLPAEVLKVKGEREAVVSVLESANNELVVLYANSTRVARIRLSDVEARAICSYGVKIFIQKPILSYIGSGPRTAPCPSG